MQVIAQHDIRTRTRLQRVQKAAIGRKFIAGRQPRQFDRRRQLTRERIKLQQVGTGLKLHHHQRPVRRSFDATARLPERRKCARQRQAGRRKAVHPQSLITPMDKQPVVAPVGMPHSTQALIAGREDTLIGQHHAPQAAVEPHVHRKIRQAPAPRLGSSHRRRSPDRPLDLIHGKDVVDRILPRRLDDHGRLFGRKTTALHALHIVHDCIEPVPNMPAIL